MRCPSDGPGGSYARFEPDLCHLHLLPFPDTQVSGISSYISWPLTMASIGGCNRHFGPRLAGCLCQCRRPRPRLPAMPRC